jgi:hypothetical protein
MNRREFIKILTCCLIAATRLTPGRADASHPREKNRHVQFVFAQLRYRGGDWNPHPLSAGPFIEELMRRTSIEAAPIRHDVSLRDPGLFSYPFLYMAGKYDFEPFSEEEIQILRRFLSYGGFLLADDALGQPGYGFDKSLRREMKRVFPEKEFERLSSSHAALRSYYLLRSIGGRIMARPYLEGITLGKTTPVIYCHNDLGGAWERDHLGNWLYPCTPGGEEQRKDAFHVGINLVLYAMTGDYKEDLIHVPFIRKRLTQ